MRQANGCREFTLATGDSLRVSLPLRPNPRTPGGRGIRGWWKALGTPGGKKPKATILSGGVHQENPATVPAAIVPFFTFPPCILKSFTDWAGAGLVIFNDRCLPKLKLKIVIIIIKGQRDLRFLCFEASH